MENWNVLKTNFSERKLKHYLSSETNVLINPSTPGTFCKKCVFWTFWWFLGWISAKLPLIRWKMRLQLNSLPFLPPASRFSPLWLGHAKKSKFWEFLGEKVTYVFRLFDFWIFCFRPSFFSFSLVSAAVIDLLLDLLAVKNFWKSVIERGNF